MAWSARGSEDGTDYMKQRPSLDQEIEDISPPFDVGDDPDEVALRGEVLRRFFAAGGGLIDSSPMYGRSERLLGELLPGLPHAGRLVAESKVWTPFDTLGPGQ